jgi:hypothetical protein
VKVKLFLLTDREGQSGCEASTCFGQSAQRWLRGCQSYAPVALYPAGRFLVLVSVRGWVNPKAIARLEGLHKLKNPITLSVIKLATFRLVAQCLNQLQNIIVKEDIQFLLFNDILKLLALLKLELHSDYINDMDRIWKEMVVAYFKVLSQHMSKEIEGNYEIPEVSGFHFNSVRLSCRYKLRRWNSLHGLTFIPNFTNIHHLLQMLLDRNVSRTMGEQTCTHVHMAWWYCNF